jgi:hypothetical protein
MKVVRIHRDVATVDDLLAHAGLLAATASTEEQFAAAARMQEIAKIALDRAGGNRATRLRDVSDQRFN